MTQDPALPEGMGADSLFSPWRMPSGLEAGAHRRRMAAFRPGRLHINTLIAQSGATIAARCEWLVRNNAYASNASNAWASNAVGTGIRPSMSHRDESVRRAVHDLWEDWIDEADAEGLTDFYGLQRRIAKAVFDVGESFVRIRYRFASDGLCVPLQLELIPAAQCPLWYNTVLDNGNVVRQGVEFDNIGRRVAYWVFRRNPADMTQIKITPNLVTRIPAEQLIHVFDPTEAGQIRGVPKLAPAVAKLFLLDEYDDAELDRAKVQALFVGFIRKLNPEGDPVLPVDPAAVDDTGAAPLGLEPGSMQVLLPGEDVQFAQPKGVAGSYEAFQYRTLLAIASALGIPYAELTSDLVQANYSSQRAGILAFRRKVEQFQASVLHQQLCKRVWNCWIDQAVLAGAIDLPGYAENPRPFRKVQWIADKWDWVDPLKDLQAEKLAIDMGVKAPSDVITGLGQDPSETYQRIAADQRRAADLGLRFADAPAAPPADDAQDDEPVGPKRPGVRPIPPQDTTDE